MPDDLAVESNSERGRHLVAQREIAAGSQLLSDLPFEAVLYDDQLPLRCSWTFAEEETLLRCSRYKTYGLILFRSAISVQVIGDSVSRCQSARYSTREAQLAAWKRGHQQECSALRACAPNKPPATVRLAARVIWKGIRSAAWPCMHSGLRIATTCIGTPTPWYPVYILIRNLSAAGSVKLRMTLIHACAMSLSRHTRQCIDFTSPFTEQLGWGA